MKVKICGMKDTENIRAIAALKPDYMGFIFYSTSPRFADLATVQALIPELINNGITPVAVMVNEEIETVKALIQTGFTAVQLHGQESVAYCQQLVDFRATHHLPVEIIKVFGVDSEFDFEQTSAYTAVCDYFLFDTKSPKHGGTGQKFDWNILSRYQQQKPYFLSGGIGLEEIENGKWEMGNGEWMYGLDLNSKLELAPGIKDVELVKQSIVLIKGYE